MIVSLPAEVAETICCSMELPIFALKDYVVDQLHVDQEIIIN